MSHERQSTKMTVAEQVHAALKQSLAHARGQLMLRVTKLPTPKTKRPASSRRRAER